MKEKKYAGQIALITGATQGIGLELARCCAHDGYDVILVARHEEALRITAREIEFMFEVKATTVAIDLMEPDSAYRLYDIVKAKGMRVDVLVNDAGQGVWGPFCATEWTDELRIIQLNIVTPTLLTKLFLLDMITRNSGKILNVSSIAAKSSTPFMAVYGATKAYSYNFTQALISELTDSKVTVTALLPGPTNTQFFRKARAQHTVVCKDMDLADPSRVAYDGYQAMQAGESKIISGWSNRLQLALGNLISDQTFAEMAKKQNVTSKNV